MKYLFDEVISYEDVRKQSELVDKLLWEALPIKNQVCKNSLKEWTILIFKPGASEKESFNKFFDLVASWLYLDSFIQIKEPSFLQTHNVCITRKEEKQFLERHAEENVDLYISPNSDYDKKNRPKPSSCTIS